MHRCAKQSLSLSLFLKLYIIERTAIPGRFQNREQKKTLAYDDGCSEDESCTKKKKKQQQQKTKTNDMLSVKENMQRNQ